MEAVESTNERQYHNTSSAYVLPNDAVEQDRLDAQAAAIVKMIGGAPFMAPVKAMTKVSKAVDIGCGTGAATLQIANIFPSAKVYGLDISPVPEAVRQVAPENITWVVGNVLDVVHEGMSREVFTLDELDYIFGRMLILGIDDWSRYFSTAYQSLKSGGIIEHQDLDLDYYRVGTSECLSDRWEWHRAFVSAAEHAGLSVYAGSDAVKIMKGLGLEIISVQTFEYSFVPSSKTPDSQAMGEYVGAKLVPLFPEMLRKMLGALGITGEELERLIKDSIRDITSEEGVHVKYTVTVARKP